MIHGVRLAEKSNGGVTKGSEQEEIRRKGGQGVMGRTWALREGAVDGDRQEGDPREESDTDQHTDAGVSLGHRKKK